jgi:magnesium transporter
MKVFTVLAFVTLPLSLIASIFNMNVSDMPLASQPYGFWIIIAGMAAVSLVMLWYFRYKRWF